MSKVKNSRRILVRVSDLEADTIDNGRETDKRISAAINTTPTKMMTPIKLEFFHWVRGHWSLQTEKR